MASPLVWKVYNERGELVGATRYAEEAAAVLACNGDGAKVKRNGRVVYKQGAGRDCDGRAFVRQSRHAHGRTVAREPRAAAVRSTHTQHGGLTCASLSSTSSPRS
jgi:hypothetical protein